MWFAFAYELAGGDITKFDKIMDMSFILALNFLGYKKQFKK